jgi:hypothetical protein
MIHAAPPGLTTALVETDAVLVHTTSAGA